MTAIEQNAYMLLEKLFAKRDYVNAENIHELTGLSPNDINDAVEHLENIGALKVQTAMGTAPYNFLFVEVTVRGRIIYQQSKEESAKPKEQTGVKVLILASNPSDTPRLNIEEEVRQITLKIQASSHREFVQLIPAFAVRTTDLLQLLNQFEPQIVHFSGHGHHSGEIILTNESGESQPVSSESIKALFTAMKDNIRVVLLNACYSQTQAKAITEVIDCAIGFNDSISDDAAISFAAAFYRAIGFGRSVKNAFDQAIVELKLQDSPEVMKPVLLARNGADPSEIFLVG